MLFFKETKSIPAEKLSVPLALKCLGTNAVGTKVYSRAATNDYFDNRLVGRLFFRLIGLNTVILLTKNTLFLILLNVLQTN